MKAMILAAGLGTRLRPHTNYKPKALLKVGGQALLEICIKRLIRYGFDEIIINVHHFAEQIIAFVGKHENFGAQITFSDEQDKLLDTGGGLKKAAWFFDDGLPFLLCNTDIISNIDLARFYQSLQPGSLATLAVRQRQSSRYLIFDEKQTLTGWQNIKTGNLKMCRPVSGEFSLQAFSGLHVISPALFELMPADDTFSIIDVYLSAATQHTIKAYPHDADLWMDAGKSSDIEAAEKLIRQL